MVKRLGLIGGIAPASTIDYYRLLIEEHRARTPDGAYPDILINSINFQRFLSLVTADDRKGMVEYLLTELDRLARAGADLALFASNTPHLVFDEIEPRSPLPLVSIVEATGAAAAAQGLKRVGLLGTGFTMDGGFYPKVFARYGVAVEVPGVEDRAWVHERYFAELVHNQYLPQTRAGMVEVIGRMRQSSDIDGVILGGTELPLLLREGAPIGLPLLDTTRLHVERAVARLLALDT
ncbi:MAG: amino acid racemase [Gemmatimonadales bacterium]|nr:amino acid racemase [Gemmatimonadales bacterium]